MTYRLHKPTHSRSRLAGLRHYNRRRYRAYFILLAFCVSQLTVLTTGAVQAYDEIIPPPTPQLLITAVQTGGCDPAQTSPCIEQTAREYVEIHNPTDNALTVSGWQLRYVSASGSTITPLSDISGTIAARSFVLLAHAGFYDTADLIFGTVGGSGKLAKTGGHVEIVDSSTSSIDLVGWGSAQHAPGAAPAAPSTGKMLERMSSQNGRFVYSGDNLNDLRTVAATRVVRSGGFTAANQPIPNPAPAPDTGTDTDIPEPAPTPTPIPVNSCYGVVINELLPNPAGSDAGHEFIELHNPTSEVINLQGCSLQTSASTTKTYAFTHMELQPGEYRSFTDSTTGLSLPNAAGGTVWLLDASEELQAVSYPAELDDNVAWALTDGAWANTYTPTAGAANIATPLKPCEDTAQVRNPETGRCATPDTDDDQAVDDTAVAAVAGLAPCKPGQERNPATNRCRMATASGGAAASSLTPCKAGQERNPETNRCRAAGSAAAETKPCPGGQERNPATNRCRKTVATVAAGSGSGDVAADSADASSGNSRMYWIIAGGLLAAAIGYAVFEWRQEIGQAVKRWTGRYAAASSALKARQSA